MVELENVTLCAKCSNPALFALVTTYVNPNYLEVSISSEKEHPDLAQISIDNYVQWPDVSWLRNILPRQYKIIKIDHMSPTLNNKCGIVEEH